MSFRDHTRARASARRSVFAPAVIACAALVSGCGPARHNFSATQLSGFQTREVPAGAEQAFDAASGALMDSGYTITLTDRDAGLITAAQREAAAVAEDAAVLILSTILTMGHAPMMAPDTYHVVCVQVIPTQSGRTAVRMQTYVDGTATVNQEQILELWALMERQTLMRGSSAPAK